MAVSVTQFQKLAKIIKEKVLLGNEPNPELIAILTVYFVQGILGLARLAVSFFLKDDIGLNPAEVAALTGIASIPWVIKPVFGFISDGVPLFGFRRRPYLILSGLLGSLSWLALATLVDTPITATIAIFMTSFAVAISDVIVDSLVVTRARKESLEAVGSLQSLCWGFSALGGLITAYLSGWLLERFTVSTIFGITATFPLIVSAVAWLIHEEKVSAVSSSSQADQALGDSTLGFKNQVSQLWGALQQKSIWLPVLFLFIWQATPNSESAFFFFSTNDLGFQPEFLGRLRLVTSIASLIGIFVFQKYLKDVSFRKVLVWSTIIAATLGMTTLLLVTHANRSLGIDDRLFSLGDSLILTVMGQITWMPVLVLSARLCPKGVEATLFALLMSVWNLSLLLSNEIGALITAALGITETNFDNLWILIIITNLSTLLPLIFIRWIPADDPQVSFAEAIAEEDFPLSEASSHHLAGSMIESSLLPDIVPDFVVKSTPKKKSTSDQE